MITKTGQVLDIVDKHLLVEGGRCGYNDRLEESASYCSAGGCAAALSAAPLSRLIDDGGAHPNIISELQLQTLTTPLGLPRKKRIKINFEKFR